MEMDAENNGNANKMNALVPVAAEQSGEGLPYAPENWPEPGDVWGWRTGRRVAMTGHFLDRYLYLPMRLSRAENPGRKYRLCFPSKLSVERYIKSKFPETDLEVFFASFSWKIPSIMPTSKGNLEPIAAVPLQRILLTELSASDVQSDSGCKVKNKACSSLVLEKEENNLAAMPCDICCAEPGFCRDCCCILCCKTVDLAYGGYSYIKCQEKVGNHICGHIAHLECALRSRMAGTIGGTIGLDTEYHCRRCDGRTDLIPHVNKLLQTCKTIDSRDGIGKILNLGACLLRGTKKAIAKELLTHIELANLKLKCGERLEDIWKVEGNHTASSAGKYPYGERLEDIWKVVDNHTASSAGKYPYGERLEDIWKVVGNHTARSAGFSDNGDAAMEDRDHESRLDVRTESYIHLPELLKLEVEIDQVLVALRKSQELEYKMAEERLHEQKNYLKTLYQQLKSEKSELVRRRSSHSDASVIAIRKREEQIRREVMKLEDMKRIFKGFGRTPRHILKEHFGLEIAD